MNSILEKRAVAIARSFRELRNYSPTKEIIKYLIENGKIDLSEPIQNAKNAILEYFLTDGLKYNIHIPIFLKEEDAITVKQKKLDS
jgi:hypothetical protein